MTTSATLSFSHNLGTFEATPSVEIRAMQATSGVAGSGNGQKIYSPPTMYNSGTIEQSFSPFGLHGRNLGWITTGPYIAFGLSAPAASGVYASNSATHKVRLVVARNF
jgi:hypothetical protein